MRFVHPADWHLGRLMHGVHLTEDQAHVPDLKECIDVRLEVTSDRGGCTARFVMG